MSKYSEDELAMLTEEERAGLEESTEFDEDTTATAATTDDASDTTTVDEKPIIVKDDGDTDTTVDDAAADATTDDAAKPTVEADTATVDDTPAPRRAVSALPEDYDDQVAKVQSDLKELGEKFDEGDITPAEYHQEFNSISRKERELERLKDHVEYDTRARYDHWVNVDVANFMHEHGEYKSNQMLATLLDQEVRKLQVASDNDTDPALLAKAHEAISKAMPAMFAQANTADTTTEAAKVKADIKRVPSLANVPAAEVDQPGSTKFDSLDRLADTDPLKYEEAISKLSDAERDEYLAS